MASLENPIGERTRMLRRWGLRGIYHDDYIANHVALSILNNSNKMY